MSEILFNILTKIGEISGVAAMIMTYIFYRQISAEKSARTKEIREWEELKSKLTNLEEEKFSDLSNKVENHIKEVDTHIKDCGTVSHSPPGAASVDRAGLRIEVQRCGE